MKIPSSIVTTNIDSSAAFNSIPFGHGAFDKHQHPKCKYVNSSFCLQQPFRMEKKMDIKSFDRSFNVDKLDDWLRHLEVYFTSKGF
jgi:hypothetical protein